ncbi:inosose dehydratase [Deinococcus metalli]|uniref:Inosose dehydratase n=1 Tax=Deinococcus metalli TaxID=1141878 RepID=A0A7W8KCI9_9DEIO|nr:TIM barrel protein [Deinococcus metalli]MBB5375687.1 inosose dehydratase [Deinococcus metalli]GHF37772.1 sugar phosphate isomerase/epimerase IoIE [Deinococcus metalli]
MSASPSSIRFGNAPCSWGTIEGFGEGVPAPRMLDELVLAGYRGTELGDYGYLPTDIPALRAALHSRNLTMLGAYEGVYLRDPAAHAEGEARVLRIARQLAAVADVGDGWSPLVVLADEHSRDAPRLQNAGHITPDLSLDDAGWAAFTAGAERIARAVRAETGLRTVFHHHCGGYVETPAEIATFLERTDPALVGLVFDTGHFLYGSGTSDPAVVLEGLKALRGRVWYVHFKDMSADVAAHARTQGLTYQQAVGAGVFCELGRGVVPFPAVLGELERGGYAGWITVEQDVLPGMGEPLVSATANLDYLRGLAGGTSA